MALRQVLGLRGTTFYSTATVTFTWMHEGSGAVRVRGATVERKDVRVGGELHAPALSVPEKQQFQQRGLVEMSVKEAGSGE